MKFEEIASIEISVKLPGGFCGAEAHAICEALKRVDLTDALRRQIGKGLCDNPHGRFTPGGLLIESIDGAGLRCVSFNPTDDGTRPNYER